MPMESTEQVKSLEKAIRLIDTLVAANQPLSLHELAQRTGFAKSTIHRLLSTLRGHDLVEQSRTDGHYRPGLRLFEIGCAISNSWDVTAIAKPYMQSISNELNESVCLALLNRGEVMIMSFLESTSAFHVVSKTGAKLPVHCTVQGKVLLAFLPPSQVKYILKEHGMRVYTPNTIHTYEAFEKEMAAIRERGYAVDNSEFHVGLHSIAAPIYNVYGDPAYSLSVVSMFHAADSPEFTRAKELVLDAAREISFALGYRGQPAR